MKTLTCKNHPKARYLTKGVGHSLFFVAADPDFVRKQHPELKDVSDKTLQVAYSYGNECPCPFEDLVEINE